MSRKTTKEPESTVNQLGEPTVAGRSALPQDREILSELLKTAPAEVQRKANAPQISVRDANTQFKGRDDDVQNLADCVEGVVKATAVGSTLTATAVTGAPGVGKTTLLKHVVNELKKRKVPVIELKPEQLESAETFSNAIRTLAESRTRKALLAMKEVSGTVATKTLDYVGELGLHVMKGGAQAAGDLPFDFEIPRVEVASATLETWRRNATANVFAVLQTLRFLYPKGFALVIDEAQTLARYQGTDNETTTAGHVIGALATDSGREKAHMRQCTVLAAGLPDTPDVMDSLGSFATNRYQLQPLSRDAIRDTIIGAIAEGAKGDKELERMATDLWPDLLTEMYGDWTRHAAAASEGAKTALLLWKREAITAEWGWAALTRMADIVRDEVYEKVITDCMDEKVPDTVRDTVAWALLCNGNELSEENLQATLKEPLEQRWARVAGAPTTDAGRTDAVEKIIRGCKHAGLIDQATPKTGHVRTGTYYCPIPTLLEYLTRPLITDVDTVKRWLAAVDINHEPPGDGT